MAASRVLREEKKFIDVSLNRKIFSEDLYQSRLVKPSIKNKNISLKEKQKKVLKSSEPTINSTKNKNVKRFLKLDKLTTNLPILSAILQNFDP